MIMRREACRRLTPEVTLVSDGGKAAPLLWRGIACRDQTRRAACKLDDVL